MTDRCGRPNESPEALEWRVHLAVERPGRAAAVGLAALAAAALALYLFQSGLFALAAALVILLSTAEFLFPARYRLTAESAEMRNLHTWRRIEWRRVRKAYLTEEGIQLSPFSGPSRLEPYRGVFLRFGPAPGDRETVLAAVRRFRDAVRSDAD